MNKSLAPSRVTHADPKGRKFMSIVAAQYDKADLSEDEAQQINDTSGLAELMAKFIAENRQTKQYASEEVFSKYGYLSGYRSPKSIAAQPTILRKYFPNIGNANEALAKQEKLTNSEGYFAIPAWQTIAATYNEAVQKVLDALKVQRKGKLCNYRDGQLGSNQLRESAKKRLALEQLRKAQQGYDVLVVAAQFGLRHRGRSVRRARAVMGSTEFGLGAFEIGIMLLTHPERLKDFDDLWINCAGDEYSPGADGRVESASYFHFNDGGLEFGTSWVGDAGGGYGGSASGFLPPEAAA